MSGLALAVWMANVVLDTSGQLAFKAAATVSHPEESTLAHWLRMVARPWLWVGITCYLLEFCSWIAFLSLVPLSVGVMLGSINIVVIMLAGRWLFAERLNPLRVSGILLVTLGVTVVGAGG